MPAIRIVPQVVVTQRGYVYLPSTVRNPFLKRLFAMTFTRRLQAPGR